MKVEQRGWAQVGQNGEDSQQLKLKLRDDEFVSAAVFICGAAGQPEARKMGNLSDLHWTGKAPQPPPRLLTDVRKDRPLILTYIVGVFFPSTI